MLRPSRLLLTAAAALSLAACGGDDMPAAGDSALAADLALAARRGDGIVFADTAVLPAARPEPVAPEPRATPAPAPQPRRTEPRPAPRREQPAPARVETEPEPTPVVEAPAPERRAPTISAGSTIALTTSDRVCTGARPGDKIIAVVTEQTVGADGAVIPAGAKAVLEVTTATTGGTPEEAQITFRVKSISIDGQSHPATGDVAVLDSLERVRADAGSDKKKVVGGAIAGAILGQVLGKDTKSTVIGAAAGAAAGTAAAVASSKWEGCLPANARVRLTLGEALVLGSSG